MEKINVKVYVDSKDKNLKIELDGKPLVSELLKKLKINPVTVLISRDNELILEDEVLKENDEIKILSVISGG